MSSRFLVLGLAAAVLASVGCSGVWVQKEVYDRDVNQQREYIVALERDNAELRAKAEAYDRLKAEGELFSGANRRYDELADNLLKALSDMGVDQAVVKYDPVTQSFSFATDLLFASGSFDVTARGREILRTFAQAQKGAMLKIVGHTDIRKVTRGPTKDKLDTDTNLELSVRRATAVMGELLRSGVHERDMFVVGHGATKPRSGSHKGNRRVEIFLAGPAAEGKTSRK